MSTAAVSDSAPASDDRKVSRRGASVDDGASTSRLSARTHLSADRTPATSPFLRAAELPSREVDARLRDALRRYDAAHGEVILWLAEVVDRRLYRDFDCSSPRQYALLRLGLSRTRAGYFLRMVRSFAELPTLRAAVASGELPWTKARQVVRVATPTTQARWVEVARELPRADLERRVARAKAAAAEARRAPGQAVLGLVEGGDGSAFAAAAGDAGDAHGNGSPAACDTGTAERGLGGDAVEVPVAVTLRFTPEQLARLEALMERARRCGARGSREELILAGMEALGDDGLSPARERMPAARRRSEDLAGRSAQPVTDRRDTSEEGHHGDPRPGRPVDSHVAPGDASSSAGSGRRSSAPRYQVIVHQCETCGRAELPTSRGALPIAAATLRTILCDARVQRPGEQNRATIPPSVRREVLARDRHRCRAPGCGSSRFLDVHHRVPRSAGGANDAANLITLCSACHRLEHEKRLALPRTG